MSTATPETRAVRCDHSDCAREARWREPLGAHFCNAHVPTVRTPLGTYGGSDIYAPCPAPGCVPLDAPPPATGRRCEPPSLPTPETLHAPPPSPSLPEPLHVSAADYPPRAGTIRTLAARWAVYTGTSDPLELEHLELALAEAWACGVAATASRAEAAEAALREVHDAMVTWFSSEYAEHPIAKRARAVLSRAGGTP